MGDIRREFKRGDIIVCIKADIPFEIINKIPSNLTYGKVYHIDDITDIPAYSNRTEGLLWVCNDIGSFSTYSHDRFLLLSDYRLGVINDILDEEEF